jgi:hypothetical protein
MTITWSNTCDAAKQLKDFIVDWAKQAAVFCGQANWTNVMQRKIFIYVN